MILIGELRDARDRRRPRSRPPSPATSCSRRCTRSTRPRRSAAWSSSSRRASSSRSARSSPACCAASISQRLLPRVDGGRVAAVEVMVANARIADLIRENKAEEIPEAIAEGAFFEMQTFTQALIDLVARRRGRRGDRRERRDEPPRLPRRARARARSARPPGCPRRRGGAGRCRAGARGEEAEPARAPRRRSSRDAPRRPRGLVRGARRGSRARRRLRRRRRTPPAPALASRVATALAPNAPGAVLGPSAGRRPAQQLSYRQLVAALAARRRRLRHPVAGARGDQQDRVELRPQHGPELGRRDRLDAVHAGHLAALGHRRERRRRRRPVERGGRDLLRRALPRRAGGTTDISRGVFSYNHARLVRQRGARLAQLFGDVGVDRRRSRSTGCRSTSTQRAERTVAAANAS